MLSEIARNRNTHVFVIKSLFSKENLLKIIFGIFVFGSVVAPRANLAGLQSAATALPYVYYKTEVLDSLPSAKSSIIKYVLVIYLL